MELYRIRWQVEIAFKRMKSLLGLGQLPKKEPQSCIAWLEGKMFVSLLILALLDEGNFFPHGATQSEEFERESNWRETSIMFEIIKQAIGPEVNLLECLYNWASIKTELSEKPRSRKLQLKKQLHKVNAYGTTGGGMEP